ncbi:unnamed protein product [Phytophthora fragariaefolia]|uniref:Unnamed protein product n=1 Tax=Phytophthora fragariaefolia TaxID=1490495 RepID=A0A9W7CYL4_9STRA|nr:unnamed protein product [Phytophthora fragariaefolia]
MNKTSVTVSLDDGVAFLRSKAEKKDIEFGGGADLAIHQTFTALKILDLVRFEENFYRVDVDVPGVYLDTLTVSKDHVASLDTVGSVVARRAVHGHRSPKL